MSVANIQPNINNRKNISFNSKESYLFNELHGSLRHANTFIKSQENLSYTRFIQDNMTNWLPKAVFARSLADFGDMSFLEFLESGIFYFAPPILGEFLFRRNVFAKFTPKNIRKEVNEQLPKSAENILKNSDLAKKGITKRALPIKAAIILACLCIPAAEYGVSFAKNLFTLKVFKKSNFNNIANLDKKQIENKEHQEKVKKSAIKHLKNAGIFSLASLGASVIFAAFGHKSRILQKSSDVIVQPGAYIAKGLKKIGLHSEKVANFLKKYITMDFNEKNGKLVLSKGQLLITASTGFFGYNAAGKDRGRLDQLEVWTRVPIVVFYTAFGGSLFDSAFKNILIRKNKFTDLIKKGQDGLINIPTRAELPQIAEKIAKAKNTSVQKEFERLLKEKTVITAVPYAFSLVFMGFLLAGITRFWTNYRFKHGKTQEEKQDRYRNLIRFESRIKGF